MTDSGLWQLATIGGVTRLVVNASGNAGIGTVTPAHRLSISGGPSWTSNGWTGALSLDNASAIGWQGNTAGNRFGVGQSTGGLYFFRTASDPGTTGSPANYDMVITDSGNITQARDKGGFVKAMLLVNANGTIARCYNGITNSSSGNCGFNVTHGSNTNYVIDFGFRVDDRFISVTPFDDGGLIAANVNSITTNGIGIEIAYSNCRNFLDCVTNASFFLVVFSDSDPAYRSASTLGGVHSTKIEK